MVEYRRAAADLVEFLDHTDDELARMSGKSRRIGHLYDLASDALMTILLFIAIGVDVAAKPGSDLGLPAAILGLRPLRRSP